MTDTIKTDILKLIDKLSDEHNKIIKEKDNEIKNLKEINKCNDNLNIIESQAKAIKDKDDYINQLEAKKVNEQIIEHSNKPLTLEVASSDDDIEFKTVKYEKKKYYIIVGEIPQYLYKIDNGEIGNKIGIDAI